MQGSQDSQMEVSAILGANKLTYRLNPDLSVAVQRNNQSQFFQNQSYAPNTLGVCIWNTGSNFVDSSRSALVLTVKNSSLVPAWFGPSSSACGLINRITIMSRSGSVIELIQNSNQLAAHTLAYRHDRSWRGENMIVGETKDPADLASIPALSNGGNAMLYGATGKPLGATLSPAALDYSWAAGETQRFIIPLSEISPFFSSCSQLLPASLCSGLRIEILFELAGNALMSTTSTASAMDYLITDCRFETECYQLSDMVLRSLNDQASSSGLEIVGVTAYNTQFNRTQAAVSVDVSKAVSRAISYIYRERPVLTSAETTKDHFACVPVTTLDYPEQYQARIGGLYYPQQSVRSAAGWRTACSDLYFITLQSLGALGWAKSGIATNFYTYLSSQFSVTQTLERESVLGLSGVPLSNSRLLNVQMQWNRQYLSSASTVGDLFLIYAILVRIFVSGTNVEV